MPRKKPKKTRSTEPKSQEVESSIDTTIEEDANETNEDQSDKDFTIGEEEKETMEEQSNDDIFGL